MKLGGQGRWASLGWIRQEEIDLIKNIGSSQRISKKSQSTIYGGTGDGNMNHSYREARECQCSLELLELFFKMSLWVYNFPSSLKRPRLEIGFMGQH